MVGKIGQIVWAWDFLSFSSLESHPPPGLGEPSRVAWAVVQSLIEHWELG